MSKKCTTEEFIAKAKKVHGDKYDYLKSSYINNKTKVLILCPDHGEFSQRPDQHLQGKNCLECGKKLHAKKNSSTTKEFITKAKKVHGDKYDYSRVKYTMAHEKIEIICRIHGSFRQTPNSHLRKHNCPECAKINSNNSHKMCPEEFVAKAKKVHGKAYNYSKTNFNSSKTKVTIICPAHGEFKQTSGDHLQNHGCPKCAMEKSAEAYSMGKKEFIKKANKTHNNKYDYSGTYYVNNKTPVQITCPKHGVFEQRPDQHLHKTTGCPRCGNGSSKEEQAIYEFVLDIHNSTINRDRKSIRPLELDIFIPDKALAIEYNGLYFHSDEAKQSNKYHRNKWKECNDKGIKLIQIFEDEWRDKKDLIKKKLSAMLGRCGKYGARKCELKPMTSKEAGMFYRKTHMQGHATDMKISYGLFFKDDPVGVASFSFDPEKNLWKVERYATEGRVQGGFSKIFKRFVGDRNPDKVLSYADLRWGNGDVFGHAGFIDEGITVPDYWWTDFKIRISRYKVQKRPEGMTERGYCESKGWKRITGVGHRKWMWYK